MEEVLGQVRDLRHLEWDERAATSGTSGCLLKSRELADGRLWYYKLSCYDSYRGIYGHECVNELVCSRLATALGIHHVPYDLVHARIVVDGVEYVTWMSRSVDFKRPGEHKIALDTYYDLKHLTGESPLDFCERLGWGEDIRAMVAFDYLIGNRDRHGANIEVLRGADGSVRLAPFFDHGLSLVFSCYADEGRAAAFDVMADVDAKNYLGSRSLEYNLGLLRERPALTGLSLEGVHGLVSDLDDVLPEVHRSKIAEFVWRRWRRYEGLLDNR